MHKILVVIAFAAMLGMAATSVGVYNLQQSYADRTYECIDLDGRHTCQHFNNGNDVFVGNPHYACCGGEKTGDPHGQTIFNPESGNPHCGPEVGCIKR